VPLKQCLVTGARGMLGTDLCPVFATRYEVIATDVEDLDISDIAAVMAAFEQFRPVIVVHLAAATDVDHCEENPDTAFRVNTIGTQNVALACQRYDAQLVHLSTLAVFDGEKPTAYTEFDTPNPQSWYSKSKYQAELMVRQHLHQHYIVRAGWMFGGGREDKKFVAKVLELARQRDRLTVVNDKFGSPIYTVDLARGILRLLETRVYGTYHMVNIGPPASRYEVAQHILDMAGIASCQLVPASSAEFPLPAPRPRMEAGRNYQLELRGWDWMRPWPDALREYIMETLLPGLSSSEVEARE